MLKLVFRSWGILAALVISFDAQAFRLEEHATLTRLAATEFEICYPGLLDISSIDALVDSNLNEDRNLPRKWLQYSHFYNPTKPILDLRKFPSEVSASDFRLGQLQTTIEGISISSAQTAAGIMDFFKQSLPELGHAIHHIQDMASPPHVVPVMHDLRDRYESLIMKPSVLPDL